MLFATEIDEKSIDVVEGREGNVVGILTTVGTSVGIVLG